MPRLTTSDGTNHKHGRHSQHPIIHIYNVTPKHQGSPQYTAAHIRAPWNAGRSQRGPTISTISHLRRPIPNHPQNFCPVSTCAGQSDQERRGTTSGLRYVIESERLSLQTVLLNLYSAQRQHQPERLVWVQPTPSNILAIHRNQRGRLRHHRRTHRT